MSIPASTVPLPPTDPREQRRLKVLQILETTCQGDLQLRVSFEILAMKTSLGRMDVVQVVHDLQARGFAQIRNAHECSILQPGIDYVMRLAGPVSKPGASVPTPAATKPVSGAPKSDTGYTGWRNPDSFGSGPVPAASSPAVRPVAPASAPVAPSRPPIAGPPSGPPAERPNGTPSSSAVTPPSPKSKDAMAEIAQLMTQIKKDIDEIPKLDRKRALEHLEDLSLELKGDKKPSRLEASAAGFKQLTPNSGNTRSKATRLCQAVKIAFG
jgi:hypothetical protein